MINLVTSLVRGLAQTGNAQDMSEKPKLSREEMTELFAEDLARPALRKRQKPVRNQPRRLIAGRDLCLS
ncbi:MAG: hypothetical protein AAF727_15330 [Pseudomonadota bacterium]